MAKIEWVTKPVEIHCVDKPFQIPDNEQQPVKEYWKIAQQKYPYIFNGTVFQMISFDETDERYYFVAQKMSYDYMLYCYHLKVPRYILYASAWIETSDQYYLLGEMGVIGVRPMVVQLAGGSMDMADLVDGRLLPELCVAREVEEELGFSLYDSALIKDFSLQYLKRAGESHNIGFIYKVQLHMTKTEIQNHYKQFAEQLQKNGQLPEFSQLVFVPKTKKGITRFLQEDSREKNVMIPYLLQTEIPSI